MLFRPTADQRLDSIHALLEAWNAEADRFRLAAIAARRGESPNSLTAAAAEEAHDSLMELLEDLDQALNALSPGHPNFAPLLQAQTTAMALLESVGNSYEILAQLVTETVTEPTHIAHDLRIAAE